MWRHILMVVGLLVLVLNGACSSFDNTPKRLPVYLPPVSATGEAAFKANTLPLGDITAVLVVINDTGFQMSAPGLQPGTLQNLGGYLQEEIQNQLCKQVVDINLFTLSFCLRIDLYQIFLILKLMKLWPPLLGYPRI